MSTSFYFSMDCENCNEEILSGLNVTTIEHRGHGVIPFDMAAQGTFVCDRCDTEHYTGDMDVHTEGGRDDWDEDEEDTR